MSEEFYSGLASDAAALVEEFGRPAVLIRRGEPATGDDDPIRPNRGEPERLGIHLVETDNSITREPGTVIKRGDVFGIMAATGEAPDELRDRLEDEGQVYEFARVKRVMPGLGGAVLYEYHARQ